MNSVAALRSLWQSLKGEIISKFNELWDYPELGNMEFFASSTLCDWLEHHGFCVERGYCGIPTAFRAVSGKGAPRIGLLAEYDALPGTDNDCVAYRKRRGKMAGHACGHNLIGSANCGAAIAAALIARQAGVKGEIIVLGTPAEEIVWGKVALLGRGGFDKIDVLLTSHGDYQNGAISRPCQSVVNGEVVFLGQSGHGGSVNRRNALDAAELAVQSIERLRGHHFPEILVEHVLRKGGMIPNVTPDEARLWLTARGVDFERVAQVFDFTIGIAGQAADMVGVDFRHQFISATRGYLPNNILAQNLYESLKFVGAPKWRDEDIDFMRELVGALRSDGKFTLDEKIDLYDEGVDPYGQDDGDASWRIPLGRINWAFPHEVPLHHWALTALAGHPSSHPGALMASEALAISAYRLLTMPSIIFRARKELLQRTSGFELGKPAFGAFKTMQENPDSFWNANWEE